LKSHKRRVLGESSDAAGTDITIDGFDLLRLDFKAIEVEPVIARIAGQHIIARTQAADAIQVIFVLT